MRTKSKNPSATASRALPSLCFGFIALTSNSYKSWSFPVSRKTRKTQSLTKSLVAEGFIDFVISFMKPETQLFKT